MVDYTFEQTGCTGVLTFYGDLTSRRESQIRSALMATLGSVEHLVFDFQKVTRLDEACLSFLHVARDISRAMNKKLTFIGLGRTQRCEM